MVAPPPSPHAAAHQTGSIPTGATRPVVALIHLVKTPYWLHLHRRIDREVPEIELHSLYTHDIADQPWALDNSLDVRPLSFGDGKPLSGGNPLRSISREWARAGRIIRWLKEHNARFVVLYGYNDAGRVRILRWCRRHRIPCLISADSNVKLDRATGFKKILKTLIVSSVVRSLWGVMPFGSAGSEYFWKYGAKRERTYRFPAEPDYAVIEQVTPAEVDAIRARFNMADGRRRIVFCGRLIDLKSPDTLIDAFNNIASQRPDWDLVMIGDGPLRQELQARVKPELASRVIWTGFLGDAPSIAAVYRAGDALVLPSKFDQWALVVNEALVAGLAIITTDVVGSAEDLLRPGVNGYTFPVGDVARLTEILLDVTHPHAIAHYQAGSRQVIKEWRAASDPIDGLRRALRDAGVLPASPATPPP